MDRKRSDELVHAWLDGELDAAGADELLAALRADPALRREVEALEAVVETARDLPVPPLPPGFLDRTMSRVAATQAPRASRLAAFFRTRVELTFAHLAMASLGAVLVAGGVAGSVGFSRGQTEAARQIAGSEVGEVELVRFVLRAADARSVELAGDFNGWTPAPLARLPDGSFEAVLPLARGRHQYAFRVDGTWQPDPAAPATVDDGFGGRNSVLEL